MANHNASKGNFSSDILYSICNVTNETGERIEVLLHTVLGKKNMHFTVFIPSIRTQLNTLKRMLLADADRRSSGPMSFMQHCPSTSQVNQITSNPTNCFNHLATIDKQSQSKFKQMIRETLHENSVELKPNERLVEYLRRRCHRDESKHASERFANEFDCTIGRTKTNKNKRGSRKASAAKEAALEAIKWDEEEVSAWNKLAELQRNTTITSDSLKSSNQHEKFACFCSLNKSDINNKSRCILHKVAEGKWEILDETGIITIALVQDTDDEGPVKEWGLWYCLPRGTDIENAKVLPDEVNTTSDTNVSLNATESFMDGLEDFADGYKLLDDDAEPEDIQSVALLASVTNKAEDCVIEYANGGKANSVTDEIRIPRELGIGITVSVQNELVTCNCEIFNRWLICRHCIYFEFLHCGKQPEGDATDGNKSYTNMRETIIEHIKAINI